MEKIVIQKQHLVNTSIQKRVGSDISDGVRGGGGKYGSRIGTVFNIFVQLLGNVDDLDIVTRSVSVMIEAFLTLERTVRLRIYWLFLEAKIGSQGPFFHFTSNLK